jgi:hypothetical protein
MLILRTAGHFFYAYKDLDNETNDYFDELSIVWATSISMALELCFNLVVVYYLISQNSRQQRKDLEAAQKDALQGLFDGKGAFIENQVNTGVSSESKMSNQAQATKSPTPDRENDYLLDNNTIEEMSTQQRSESNMSLLQSKQMATFIKQK